MNPDQTVSYLIATTPVGSRIPLDIIRDGRPMRVTVTVGQRPTDEELARQLGVNDNNGLPQNDNPAVPANQTLGLTLAPLTQQIIQALNLPAGSRGVVVMSVDPNSPAADRLQRGDVILSVNRQPVTTPAQFQAAVDAARRAGRTSVLLLAKRGNGPETFVGIDLTAR